MIDPQTRSEGIALIQRQLHELYEEIIVWVRTYDPALLRGVDTMRAMVERKSAQKFEKYDNLISLLGAGIGYRILEACQRDKRALTLLPQLECIKKQIRDQRLVNLMAVEGP